MSAASRRTRIDLAYDGTDFAGWQVQPSGRTVQGTVEDALRRIQGNRPLRLRGAGRTDAGVHARRQVADCEITTSLDDEGLRYSLSGMLPEDVRPLEVCTVEPEFHSRRSATRRTYRYRLDRTAVGDPFLRRFALHHRQAIDSDALSRALAALPGERDWSGFAGAGDASENRVRHLTEASWVDRGPTACWFSFTSSGFVNYMVRNLVGTLLEIARGRLAVERIEEILESGDRRLAGPTAAAHGLWLWRVAYPGDSLPDDPTNPSLWPETR